MNRLRIPKLTFLILIIASVSQLNIAQQTPKETKKMPDWVKKHMSYMTEGTGRWIADNSEFKSANEPYDKYCVEWKWGIGKQSIKGRLFGIQREKETAEFWEFYLFWHPQKQKVIIQQISGNGILGVGEIINVESGGKTERMSQMTFFTPDGKSWKDLHKIFEDENEHQTTSFVLKNSTWNKQRSYIWKRVAK